MLVVSLWPLIAAATAAIVIGYVWYHPRTFGALWMRFSGMTPEMAERGSRHLHLYEAVGFVACFAVAATERMVLSGLGVGDVLGAARVGVLLFCGFAAPILLGSVLWEHRPITLYCINAGYWLVALVVMAVILVL